MKITIECNELGDFYDLIQAMAGLVPKESIIKAHPFDDSWLMDYVSKRTRYPVGVCQKCGGVLAKHSKSYCRKHETERVKAWRLKRKGVVK